MALTVERGTFTKTTSTSIPVSQTVTLVDSTLTPKAIILFTTGQTAGDTFTDDARFSYGFSDGTNDACQAFRMDESAKAETYVWHNDSIISIHDLVGAGEISVATVSSVAAGSFTLSWTAQTDTNALIIHYIVIGGSDILNASVVNGTVVDTNTGNHSWNGTGTTFTPQFALTMTGADSLGTLNTINSSLDRATISIGATDGTNQWVVSGRDETVATSDCDMYIDNAACMANHDPANGAIDYLANFVSFNNAAGGGITLNVTNGATATTQPVAFLFFESSSTTGFECGTFQQRSGTGTQDITFTNTLLDPSLVFLGGINSASNATLVGNMYLGFGSADGTRQGCGYFGNTNAVATFTAVSSGSSTKVYRIATPAATATSSTTNAECTMNDMATRGKFQLNWTTADTTLRRMAFWTVGEVPLLVTQTTTHKYNLSAMVTASSTHRYHVGDLFTKCKVGTITKDTTSGVHTQNFTNELGFRPSAMMFWVTNRTASGTGAHIQEGIGFSDGTNNFSIATSQEDGTLNADANARSSSTASILLINQTTTTIEFDGKPIFGETGFDVEYASANTTAYKISYIAWGGSQISNVIVTSQLHAGTGSRTYTNVGFQGDIAIFLGNSAATNGVVSETGQGIGVATASNQWAITVDANTGFPTDTSRSQVTDKCMRVHTLGGAGSFITDAAFTAFTSNGYTLNYTTAATADAFGVLVIKGGLWDVGTFNQATSNGNQQVNITADRVPLGVLLGSFGDVATTSLVNEYRFSLGASDVTSNTSTWNGAVDGTSSNRTNDSDFSDTKCMRMITPGTTPAMHTEAQMASFANGSFTINNTTTDATSRQICFVCLSEVVAALEAVSQTSIHKYNMLQYVAPTTIQKYNLRAYLSQTSIQKYTLRNFVAITTAIQKYNLRQFVPQTIINKYNLRQYIPQTNIHKYNLRKLIASLTIHKYNLRRFIAESSVQKYNLRVFTAITTNINKYNLRHYLSQTTIQKYNLRHFLSQTNIQKYNLRHYLSQASIQKYNLRQLIAQTSIHKYTIIQIATVIATNIHKYNLRQYVPQTLIQKYHLRNFVAITASIQKYNLIQNIIQNTIQKYNLRRLATASNIHRYNLIQNILSPSIQKYNLKQNITQTSIQKYTLRTFVAISNSIHKYNNLHFIMQTSIHKYALRVTVAATASIHKYRLFAAAIQTSIHKYNLKQNILAASIQKYHIIQVNQVIAVLIAKYNMRQYIISPSIQKYNLRTIVAITTNIQKYNLIHYLTLTSIHKYTLRHNIAQTTIHKYRLLQNILQTSIQKYNLRALVAPTVSIQKYNLRQLIAQINIQKYNLKQVILSTSTHKYHIIIENVVIAALIAKYNLRQYVVIPATQKYNILNTIALSSTHKYNLRHNIVQLSIHKYNLIARVLSSSIHKYHMRRFIPVDTFHKYNIRQLATATSIHKYNIFSVLQVLVQTIHKYNLRRFVITNSIHKYTVGILKRHLVSLFNAPGKAIENTKGSKLLQDFIKGMWPT